MVGGVRPRREPSPNSQGHKALQAWEQKDQSVLQSSQRDIDQDEKWSCCLRATNMGAGAEADLAGYHMGLARCQEWCQGVTQFSHNPPKHPRLRGLKSVLPPSPRSWESTGCLRGVTTWGIRWLLGCPVTRGSLGLLYPDVVGCSTQSPWASLQVASS